MTTQSAAAETGPISFFETKGANNSKSSRCTPRTFNAVLRDMEASDKKYLQISDYYRPPSDIAPRNAKQRHAYADQLDPDFDQIIRARDLQDLINDDIGEAENSAANGNKISNKGNQQDAAVSKPLATKSQKHAIAKTITEPFSKDQGKKIDNTLLQSLDQYNAHRAERVKRLKDIEIDDVDLEAGNIISAEDMSTADYLKLCTYTAAGHTSHQGSPRLDDEADEGNNQGQISKRAKGVGLHVCSPHKSRTARVPVRFENSQIIRTASGKHIVQPHKMSFVYEGEQGMVIPCAPYNQGHEEQELKESMLAVSKQTVQALVRPLSSRRDSQPLLPASKEQAISVLTTSPSHSPTKLASPERRAQAESKLASPEKKIGSEKSLIGSKGKKSGSPSALMAKGLSRSSSDRSMHQSVAGSLIAQDSAPPTIDTHTLKHILANSRSTAAEMDGPQWTASFEEDQRVLASCIEADSTGKNSVDSYGMIKQSKDMQKANILMQTQSSSIAASDQIRAHGTEIEKGNPSSYKPVPPININVATTLQRIESQQALRNLSAIPAQVDDSSNILQQQGNSSPSNSSKEGSVEGLSSPLDSGGHTIDDWVESQEKSVEQSIQKEAAAGPQRLSFLALVQDEVYNERLMAKQQSSESNSVGFFNSNLPHLPLDECDEEEVEDEENGTISQNRKPISEAIGSQSSETPVPSTLELLARSEKFSELGGILSHRPSQTPEHARYEGSKPQRDPYGNRDETVPVSARPSTAPSLRRHVGMASSRPSTASIQNSFERKGEVRNQQVASMPYFASARQQRRPQTAREFVTSRERANAPASRSSRRPATSRDRSAISRSAASTAYTSVGRPATARGSSGYSSGTAAFGLSIEHASAKLSARHAKLMKNNAMTTTARTARQSSTATVSSGMPESSNAMTDKDGRVTIAVTPGDITGDQMQEDASLHLSKNSPRASKMQSYFHWQINQKKKNSNGSKVQEPAQNIARSMSVEQMWPQAAAHANLNKENNSAQGSGTVANQQADEEKASQTATRKSYTQIFGSTVVPPSLFGNVKDSPKEAIRRLRRVKSGSFGKDGDTSDSDNETLFSTSTNASRQLSMASFGAVSAPGHVKSTPRASRAIHDNTSIGGGAVASRKARLHSLRQMAKQFIGANKERGATQATMALKDMMSNPSVSDILASMQSQSVVAMNSKLMKQKMELESQKKQQSQRNSFRPLVGNSKQKSSPVAKQFESGSSPSNALSSIVSLSNENAVVPKPPSSKLLAREAGMTNVGPTARNRRVSIL